ncbi:hypothetical protein BC332_28566 [Capsicum chinense]|nr:hypothetical protein BC332_28566 [Capsicum chinense]
MDTILTLNFTCGRCFLSSPILKVDVSSAQSLNSNENEYINENQPPRIDKEKAKISLEELQEGQANDFSTYYLQISYSKVDLDVNDSNGDPFYDVDENIDDLSDLDEELLQARQSNIEK